MDLGKTGWLVECRVDPVGSGQGPVSESCKHGGKLLGFGATELVGHGYHTPNDVLICEYGALVE
jgi:hypothetical protein